MIEHVETPHRLVALTFDDGPNPVYTLNVLEILEKASGKATFFMIGSRKGMKLAIIRILTLT